MFEWLFYSTNNPCEQDILNTLSYFFECENEQLFVSILNRAIEEKSGIHVEFFRNMCENARFTKHTVNIAKNMLVKWHSDLIDVSSEYLRKENSIVAFAIGSEKSKFNKLFYEPIRKSLSMNNEEFRKFLSKLRKYSHDEIESNITSTQKYNLCIFGDPIAHMIENVPCNDDIPILTVYKNKINRYPDIYNSLNVTDSTPLSQENVDLIMDNVVSDYPVFIICECVGKDLVLPPNVYAVYTKNTQSWGKQFVPYTISNRYDIFKNALDFVL